MKLSTFALLSVIGSASAGSRPDLTISVKDGSFGGIDGLDPTLSWSSASSTGDIDIEYGVEASATPTTDIASMPKNIWGKASGSVAGWGVSARAEFEGTDFSSADVDIDASGDGIDIHADATATSDGITVSKVEATSSFDVDGGSITVNPRYDVGSGDADVVVSYNKDDTSIEVTASADEQSVTISKQIDDDNRVAPTISSDGAFSVEWEKALSDGNTLTTTVTPNESIDIEWKDADWTASINMPVDGTEITGTNVSVKRDLSF